MLRSSESETEILLGNKQLLGVFFLVAVLLGIAFTAGFMIGRNGTAKKESAPSVAESASPQTANGSGGETHAVSPADSGFTDASNPSAENSSTEAPLGSAKRKKQAQRAADTTLAPSSSVPQAADFMPQSGQEFLQVTAVSRPDANEVAEVLRKKGFRAHAVPIANNPNVYRVIVGPIRDAGDLANTRDSLRKTGFRDVIVQRYR
jgi:cell division septation protein DedD